MFFSRIGTWLAGRSDYRSGKFGRLPYRAISLPNVPSAALELDTRKPSTWIERVLHHRSSGSSLVLVSNRSPYGSHVIEASLHFSPSIGSTQYERVFVSMVASFGRHLRPVVVFDRSVHLPCGCQTPECIF